ncbi:DUF2169 family type VI secretion system accessory protein [Vibrio sp. V39_P1S14PM300]|uniref:DUF2169 family type VI secretion system accessory protein n=1 Tax=Vibrio sp. V39_P1S14PM300 TaxID=1938690 RepID=UPI0013725776|nr:DUF2169 domain-containing protein [Vibrio sp. V39_P1S14PM300]NAX23287.1 DUF2169 domain-containing protein [Vibrio sp. V39_P1S14PM300]
MQLWDIDEHPELEVKGRFQRDHNGHEVWVLTAKRQWRWIEKQWMEERAEQVFDDPVYLGEAGFSAMQVDHDFPVYKQNTDVVVYGKARAYAKRPVTYMECRLLVDGHIDKTLAVHGSRHWVEHAGSVTIAKPQPFIERDMDYSMALGGDERNRIGGGIADSNRELLEQNVPSVFYPKEDWSANPAKVKVAGFGPVPPFFAQRFRYAGTFDQQWEEERRPLLPLDFDGRFFQSAPIDQQCKGYLQGGERMMLSGFSHDDTLSFRIPAEQYRARVMFGDEPVVADMPIYTVFVDTEQQIITLAYTAAFPCQGQEHLLTTSQILDSFDTEETA